LFYDTFFSSIVLCTDEFAMRILEAGCTGVRFVDPNNDPDTGERFHRTLKGIEEFTDTPLSDLI
jgi:hypothetical protein